MPELEKYFHYRNLDVSAVKVLAQRWFPKIAKGITKKSKHSALSDIYDSLYELNYYRENIFCVQTRLIASLQNTIR
jgi:oligoribonuclease